MIEPLLKMAFSVHENKGGYALLIGSGVSRSAGILTGWEIVEDLISRLAHAKSVEGETDLFAWYRRTYGVDAEYSSLLDELATTPTERRKLLAGYFEPTEEERQQGIKVPTASHKAIAQLVANGYVRVILTTNFDRLIERAIEDANVTPTVVSTADAVDGMMPLSHATKLIVKLHGDYLDSRIRNTKAELATYDSKIDQLLDRALDEFGLIVCGWSAEWDSALCAAIERATSRRFAMYWTTRRKIDGKAEQLVNLRAGIVTPIKDADSFFTDISEKVQSLADLDRPHPLSTKSAVATLKRYLPDDRFEIRASDLVFDAAENTLAVLNRPPLNNLQGRASNAEFKSVPSAYEVACQTIASLLAVGGYWGRKLHVQIWVKSIENLARVNEMAGGNTLLLNLRRYPALIATYAAGLGALAGDRYENLAAVLTKPSCTTGVEIEKSRVIVAASVWRVFGNEADHFLFDADGQRWSFPASHHLLAAVREPLRELVPDDSAYRELFGRFEYILALVHADIPENKFRHGHGPIGEFAGPRWRGNDPSPVETLNLELKEYRDKHHLLMAGFFGGSLERLSQAKKGVDEQVLQAGR
jgi:SIR2-like domain